MDATLMWGLKGITTVYQVQSKLERTEVIYQKVT
jgi:hypothetical protein